MTLWLALQGVFLGVGVAAVAAPVGVRRAWAFLLVLQLLHSAVAGLLLTPLRPDRAPRHLVPPGLSFWAQILAGILCAACGRWWEAFGLALYSLLYFLAHEEPDRGELP